MIAQSCLFPKGCSAVAMELLLICEAQMGYIRLLTASNLCQKVVEYDN